MPDEVAKRIRTSIGGGSIEPGKRLPTQQELAEAYGVSRPVIRGRLHPEVGWLISQQGSLRQPAGASASVSSPARQGKTLPTCFNSFMAVEVAATEQAATHRSPSDLDAIRQHPTGWKPPFGKTATGSTKT
ncbi:FadR family transcriptional regulator [Billgrantia gudaonensis]|uniref:FadR family transcriptional regulator n=1 Tax=Billgrantia gudaonensis TaxID=376427 RepID=A0A3S0NEC2_9GAMM|nr:FadR family transcriptional regulator [Halomonas gudaonensis]